MSEEDEVAGRFEGGEEEETLDFVEEEVWHRCSTTYGVLVEGMKLGGWCGAVSSAEIAELRIMRGSICGQLSLRTGGFQQKCQIVYCGIWISFLIITCIGYAATLEVILCCVG